MGKLVAYYRCSTTKQGLDGLGMEGQVHAVESYSRANQAPIIASYREVETGKRGDRPELDKAIAHAKRAHATLIIAKIDRLARNVYFTSGLMRSGVEFIALDIPSANKLTIHILAAVAEAEAEAISTRTKTALAVYKAKGGTLGNPANLDESARARGRTLGARVAKARADAFAADLGPVMGELRDRGMTLQQIADHMNGLEYKTPRGKLWNHVQVMRVLNRLQITTTSRSHHG